MSENKTDKLYPENQVIEEDRNAATCSSDNIGQRIRELSAGSIDPASSNCVHQCESTELDYRYEVEQGGNMKLMTDTMTVLQYEQPFVPCSCSLASNDMSVSLPNLAAGIDCIQGIYNTGSSNDIRNGPKVNPEKRASLSGVSEKMQFKTSSLEDCQACVRDKCSSNITNGYMDNISSNSDPSLSQPDGISHNNLAQEPKRDTEDLPVTLDPANHRLSAVLENISLVYLPHTKQLVPGRKGICPNHDNSNNNVQQDMVRTCPEGAESPTDNAVSANNTLKHFPRLEATLDSGPLLSPVATLHSNSLPELVDGSAPVGRVLSQESNISTQSHSTVIISNQSDDDESTQAVLSAQVNSPQDVLDELPQVLDSHDGPLPTTLSRTNASSFSSISSLSTATELSLSAASCSDQDSPDKVIMDSDEAGFVEINLDARSINEQKLTSKNSNHEGSFEDRLGHPFSQHSVHGAKPKRKGLTSFLTRNIFSRKAKEASSDGSPLGWRLFGKIPPKSPPARDDSAPSECALKQEVCDGGYRVKKKDIEAPSTTALILEQRPRGLPTKDPEEETRHRLQYEAMVEAAKKKEFKEAKMRKKQLQQQLKHEDALAAAVKIWNVDILPNWENMRQSKKARDLWWAGIPPSVRGRVWELAFGNDLNLTPELYEICLSRAKDRLKIMKEAGSDTDSISSFSDLPASKEASVELIKLDVSRTFPQLCIFQKGGPYHELLQGLLGAYACYRPDVGYVQGMSFIAAVLLLNMDVADAFICFSNLLNRPCQIAFFRLDESLMNVYFETYEMFFEENLPKLFNHFKKLNLASNLYIIDWLFTLYAKSLPLDVASRVWDVFCRDGEEFLFRTALGILKLHEEILLTMDFIHLAQFLTRLPETINSDDLFQALDSINMNIDKRKFTQVLSDLREQSKSPES